MDPRTVSKLEQKILEAINLMAKAAVAVFEAAVENSQSREPSQDAQQN